MQESLTYTKENIHCELVPRKWVESSATKNEVDWMASKSDLSICIQTYVVLDLDLDLY